MTIYLLSFGVVVIRVSIVSVVPIVSVVNSIVLLTATYVFRIKSSA